ncbi:hypothetical protein KI387_002126, partial [Taxus chinensis]
MDSAGDDDDVLGRPKLRRIAVKKDDKESTGREEEIREEIEPVSPAGQVFIQSSFNCYIIVIFRLKTQINVEAIKTGLESTLVQHKRFSSFMKKNQNGTLIWVPAKVNICNHVLVPHIDPADNETPDFVENFAAKLATAPPMDASRPLWQVHLLNVKSEEAASSLIMRVHHSLGDGMSLMSLLLACTRKAGDPDSLPTIPRQTRSSKFSGPNNRGGLPWILRALFTLFLIIWYTVVDVLYFAASLFWIKDSETPIKGFAGVESSPKQIVHQNISLKDIKLVKDAVKGTINDVLIGITSAGILRYLERKYEEERSEDAEGKNGKGGMPSKLRIRSAILVNIRPAPGLHDIAEMMESGKKAKWGNNLGVYDSIPSHAEAGEPSGLCSRSHSCVCKEKTLSGSALYFCKRYFTAQTCRCQGSYDVDLQNGCKHYIFLLQHGGACARGGNLRSSDHRYYSHSVWASS